MKYSTRSMLLWVAFFAMWMACIDAHYRWINWNLDGSFSWDGFAYSVMFVSALIGLVSANGVFVAAFIYYLIKRRTR